MSETLESDLLGEIVRAAIHGEELLAEAALKPRYLDEPWLIPDLRRAGLIGQHSQWLVPTIEGLRRVDTPESRQTVDSSRRVYELLRALHREDARIASRTAVEIGQRLQLPESEVGRLLAILEVSSRTAIGGWSAGPSGFLSQVGLRDAILTTDPFLAPPTDGAPIENGPITITARDFRVLETVEWSPRGVSLLAGPNGSGKSSLLEVLQFLRDAYEYGLPQAVGLHRGTAGLRRSGAEGAPEIAFGVQVGNIKWTLRLSVSGGAVGEFPGEQVTIDGKVHLRRAAFAPEWYLGREQVHDNEAGGRTCLRMAVDSRQAGAFAPLVKVIRDYSVYANYALDALRDGGAGGQDDRRLAPDGQNLFHVLRNWQGAPRRFRGQFEWVAERLRKAFPGLIEHIEFDPPVGKIVPTRLFPLGSRDPLPMSSAADGLLVGLLHLTAVAGVSDGGIIAIDEIENHLHPHAIRSILSALRELAEERHLTVVITTHSPVVMNEFREDAEQVFVMERSDSKRALPSAITELHSEEWLAHAKLGTLYDRLAFGAPSVPASSP